MVGVLEGRGDGLPPHICGYPLPGWQLGYIEYDYGRFGSKPGWIVAIESERSAEISPLRFLARSELGPLEAWDECLRNIVAAEERDASDSEDS